MSVDGIEAATQIRSKHDISIIYLTSYSNNALLERAKLTEPHGYLIKPFEENELYSMVEMALYKREVEKRLKESEGKFRNLAKELKRSNAALEEFAFIASHDLQAPLRQIASFMKLLSKRYQEKLDAEAHEFINYASDGAIQMQSFIRDLLAYSRIGLEDKEFELIDYNEVVEHIKDNLQTEINEKSATISYDFLPTIKGSLGQQFQLFQNLIENSIKYCKKRPEIKIGAKEKNGEWLFSISDNGIGIEPQFTESVFVPFKRLHASTEYSGTGIGLAICKKVVDEHGGKIWVESEKGKGSTFYFIIPVME